MIRFSLIVNAQARLCDIMRNSTGILSTVGFETKKRDNCGTRSPAYALVRPLRSARPRLRVPRSKCLYERGKTVSGVADLHSPAQPSLETCKIGCECENEYETLTPSTTNSSPQTYWLALLARKTIGPAKSFGCPHLPAGIRSEICCDLTGSFNSFSFLVWR